MNAGEKKVTLPICSPSKLGHTQYDLHKFVLPKAVAMAMVLAAGYIYRRQCCMFWEVSHFEDFHPVFGHGLLDFGKDRLILSYTVGQISQVASSWRFLAAWCPAVYRASVGFCWLRGLFVSYAG